jgi:uncharacterized phage protein (TIGR01671 family)
MKREIKFRTYCEGEMQYSGFHISAPGIVWVWTDFKCEDSRPMDTPVMQYTGIRDKDGTEIYEGDVLRCKGGEESQGYREYDITGVVTYSTSASFNVVTKDKIHYSFDYSDWDEIKIIGNIYQNPELI